MKILNLYACIGGNRLLWNKINDEIKVTAVEIDSALAKLYQKRFPSDNVIIDDAHTYLLNHYEEYDFIWSSPPCPTHSKARFAAAVGKRTKPKYPDLKLYEEIIFLKHHFKGLWIVENVIPYYEPLISGKKKGRHMYWSNFNLPNSPSRKGPAIGKAKNELEQWKEFHDYNFDLYNGTQPKIKIARNLVDYQDGSEIFAAALNVIVENKSTQLSLL